MIDLKECFEIVLKTTKMQMVALLKAKLQEEGGCIKFHHDDSFDDTSDDAMMEECKMKIHPCLIYLDKNDKVRIKYTYFSEDEDYSENFDNGTEAFGINEMNCIAKLLEAE